MDCLLDLSGEEMPAGAVYRAYQAIDAITGASVAHSGWFLCFATCAALAAFTAAHAPVVLDMDDGILTLTFGRVVHIH